MDDFVEALADAFRQLVALDDFISMSEVFGEIDDAAVDKTAPVEKLHAITGLSPEIPMRISWYRYCTRWHTSSTGT